MYPLYVYSIYLVIRLTRISYIQTLSEPENNTLERVGIKILESGYKDLCIGIIGGSGKVDGAGIEISDGVVD